MTAHCQRGKWLVRAAALGQLLLLAVILWLAADPEAHERLHPDAHRPDHECAVTLLAHGKADVATATPIVVSTPQTFFFPLMLRPVMVATAAAHLLPFACGPPSA